jgi:hypothetical protein
MFASNEMKNEIKKKMTALQKQHISNNIMKHNGLIELESQNMIPLLKDHLPGLESLKALKPLKPLKIVKSGKGRSGGKKCSGMAPYTGSGLFGHGKIESSIDGLNDGMHSAATSNKGNSAGPQMSHMTKPIKLTKKVKDVITKMTSEITDKTGSGRSGGGKKVNPWFEHVKKYAKDHGISYTQAMTASKSSYVKK